MSVFERIPTPPAGELLGWELIGENVEAKEIEVAFHPNETMLNPHGTVQGGFVAAMLDETMGVAVVSSTGGRFGASSIDLHVMFVRPVRPGRLYGKGRVIRHGRSIVFVEALLFDEEGNILAKANSSAVPLDREVPPAGPKS